MPNHLQSKNNIVGSLSSYNNPNIIALAIGMLSKSKGQVLRVAAALHVLFHVAGQSDESGQSDERCEQQDEEESYDGESQEVGEVICERAIEAAINFVMLCCQQAAFVAGKNSIDEEIQIMKASK